VADELRGVSERLARLAAADPDPGDRPAAPAPRQTLAPEARHTHAPEARQTLAPEARHTHAPEARHTLAPEARQHVVPAPEAPPPREALPERAAAAAHGLPAGPAARPPVEPPLRRPAAPPAAQPARPPLVAEPRPLPGRAIFRAPPPRLLAGRPGQPGAGSSGTGAPEAPAPAAADLAAEPVRPRRPVLPDAARPRTAALRPRRPGAAAASAARAPRDPAPSRLSYRMNRLWLTPLFRAFLQVGVPGFAAALAIGLWLSDEDRRAAIAGKGAEIVRQVQERPEFMVNLMSVEGASPEIDAAVRTALPVHFPVSSFDLDLEAMRAAVSEIDAVASADLRIRPGGILEVTVVERVPAVLWRGPNGLMLLDAGGHRVGPAESRLARPDLPLIAGEGADRAVPEALRLIEAAAPVGPRLRGLVRMGERRWDVVLDRGQRILLPAEGAVEALERVMALAEAEEMLERDVTVIDMRFGQRPTLRLSPAALETFRGNPIEAGATNG
jgi:cell division protein FtsQ